MTRTTARWIIVFPTVALLAMVYSHLVGSAEHRALLGGASVDRSYSDVCSTEGDPEMCHSWRTEALAQRIVVLMLAAAAWVYNNQPIPQSYRFIKPMILDAIYIIALLTCIALVVRIVDSFRRRSVRGWDPVGLVAVLVALFALYDQQISSQLQLQQATHQERLLNSSAQSLKSSTEALNKAVKLSEQSLTYASRQASLLKQASTSLESVVTTANAQQRVLAQNLDVSKKQLALVQTQFRQQEALQEAKPIVEFMAPGSGWSSPFLKPLPCKLVVGADSVVHAVILLHNVGNSTLTNVLLNASVFPSTVDLRSPTPYTTIAKNALQLSGANIVHGVTYTLALEIVPNGVNHLVLVVQAVGQNAVANSAPTVFRGEFHCSVVTIPH